MAEDYAPKEIIGIIVPCVRCGAPVLCSLDVQHDQVACPEHCSFDTVDDCWDDQEARADVDFVCPIHGQAHDTLDRLGIDVL